MSALTDIQKWYESNCDGDWEHQFGVIIETLDNPGWAVSIDLTDTNLEGKSFQPIKEESSEESWIDCRVEDSKFRGFGDPRRLEEILTVFLDWARSQNQNWLQPPPPASDEERQRLEDERFFASLGDEVESELCSHEGCTSYRIRKSVMCRVHHFEMVTERAIPKDAN
jgi:hypothetical protein